VRWTGSAKVQGIDCEPSDGCGGWFYRTCVIDLVLAHSPAEYVRRPNVPAESPTLGLSHLQFEAVLTAGRLSKNTHDFALVAMLGLLGLRIFEACGADIEDVGEEHGHRVLKVRGKGGKVALAPLPPAVGRAIDQAIGDRPSGPILRTVAAPAWTGTAPPADCTTSHTKAESASPGCTPTCCGTPS
jgi:integrase